MTGKKKKVYPIEFKKEAVRLALESGKPRAVIARELGISSSLLYSWINQFNKEDTVGSEKEQAQAQLLKQQQAEIKQLRTENAILKKAAAYFAKEQL